MHNKQHSLSNVDDTGSYATRFISLGAVPEVKTKDKKLKWLHALNLAPMSRYECVLVVFVIVHVQNRTCHTT